MKIKILFLSALFIGALMTGCENNAADVLEVSEEKFDFLGEDGMEDHSGLLQIPNGEFSAVIRG